MVSAQSVQSVRRRPRGPGSINPRDGGSRRAREKKGKKIKRNKKEERWLARKSMGVKFEFGAVLGPSELIECRNMPCPSRPTPLPLTPQGPSSGHSVLCRRVLSDRIYVQTHPIPSHLPPGHPPVMCTSGDGSLALWNGGGKIVSQTRWTMGSG